MRDVCDLLMSEVLRIQGSVLGGADPGSYQQFPLSQLPQNTPLSCNEIDPSARDFPDDIEQTEELRLLLTELFPCDFLHGRSHVLWYQRRVHGSVRGENRREIIPLVRVVIPQFIQCHLENPSRKDQFHYMRAEYFGEVDSEGITDMIQDQHLQERCLISAKLRSSISRKRLALSNSPEELLQQVDALVEKKMQVPRRELQETQQPAEHVALSKVQKLLGNYNQFFSRMRMSNFQSASNRRLLNNSLKLNELKKSTKKLSKIEAARQEKMKILNYGHRSSCVELNPAIKIPTLEELERRRRRRLTPSDNLAQKASKCSSRKLRNKGVDSNQKQKK
eukprot:TRINITY_DN36060_c0_g1_i1.p2 TRINITY_DN36060_c0_g1~~TRINITY_DN36060_c0_g1_i1.p2  ORF type:complete len:335 (-),score=34.04 TRINITY_DN36060_c0_g1_i1:147-1151(-)